MKGNATMPEDTLDTILNQAAAELVTEHHQMFIDWHKKIASINAYLPEQHYGDKLYQAIKDNAKSLTPSEASTVFEIGRVRLHYHTEKGKYKSEYRGVDDNLDNLPAIVSELKKEEQTANTQNLVNIFLDYCRMQSPDVPINELKEAYCQFKKVKEFYDTVPESCKDLPFLSMNFKKTDWNELRKLLKPELNEKDRVYAHWIDTFEQFENECKVNFRDIVAFITKYKRYHS